jgi:O-acetyl-ADP-ribose deacetylase (regulator of RNase III)
MGKGKITLIQGDITEHVADVIVNAANSSLLGGGGVDGAIHGAGGPAILEACKEIRSTQGECPPGHAVITTAGRLPSKYVIHTVGPIWKGGNQGEAEVLANCYSNSLSLAAKRHLRTIGFPSISTGVYGYPVRRAASVAIETTVNFLARDDKKIDRISWILFDVDTYRAYEAALAEM